jgi:hypothetical protein
MFGLTAIAFTGIFGKLPLTLRQLNVAQLLWQLTW